MAERYDAFLSYARADAEAVRTLAENLHQLGVDLFFDEWEIAAGDALVHPRPDTTSPGLQIGTSA